MKKIIFISALCFFSISLFSQNITLKGTVVNSQNNEPVIYATVGLIKANRGVSTDEKGEFELENVDVQDTLIIGSMGYKMFKILVKDAKSVILLSPSVFQLPIVTVKPRKSKTIEINHFGKKNLGAGYMNTNFDSTTQIAQLIENTDNNLWYLKEIKIARWSKTHLKKNQRTQFRIRFYSIDAYGKPDKDIYEPILVNNEADNTVKVSVNKKMLLPQKGMFIAVEWLKISENFINETYKLRRIVNGVDKGEVETNDRFYTPMVVFKYPYGKTKDCKVFELNYKGEWKEHRSNFLFREEGYLNNLALSVTVTD